jgi:hypothetical protein
MLLRILLTPEQRTRTPLFTHHITSTTKRHETYSLREALPNIIFVATSGIFREMSGDGRGIYR